MADQEKKPVQERGKDDARFRAVVKRLLDTPPMHKPAKTAAKPKRRTKNVKVGPQ